VATALGSSDLSVDGFSERILFIRTVKLRWDRKKMAGRLGHPHATVRTWERGGIPHDVLAVADRYEAVCAEEGLTIPADWLLRGGFHIWSELTAVDMPSGQMELAYVQPPEIQAV